MVGGVGEARTGRRGDGLVKEARITPEDSHVRLTEIPVHADTDAVDYARGWMDELLRGWSEVDRGRAMLVADELVANARDHGRAPVVLRVVLVGEEDPALMVAVEDGAEHRGPWRAGAGLSLVEALTSRWGVDWFAGSKNVWAELSWDDEDD